jgi:hypothetical protein
MFTFALTALGVSGTSSGALKSVVEGTTSDSQLITGHPRGIRSDEWLVNTPMIVAQASQGWPRTNHQFPGGGLDVTLVFDVPTTDWSTAFRPWTWGYFILPLAEARAWHWWSLPLALFLAVYSFTLTLLSRRILLATLAGMAMVTAPFVNWWWQSSTFVPLASCFAAMTMIVLLARAPSVRARWLWAAGLGWTIATLGLVLYPPFVIPCALVLVAFSVGLLLLERGRLGSWRTLLAPLAAAGAGVGVGALVVALFLTTRSSAVATITSTAYPGHRTVNTGSFTWGRLLSGFADSALRNDSFAGSGGLQALGGNQSEASAFALVGLFSTPVAVAQLWAAHRRGLRANPVLGLLLILLAGFLTVGLVPGTGALSTVLALTTVPASRLQIGFGMLSIVLPLAVIWEAERQQAPARVARLIAGSTAATVVWFALAQLTRTAPGFAGTTGHRLLVTLVVAAAVTLVPGRFAAVGVSVILLFHLRASTGVNPLYRGVYDLRRTALVNHMRALDARGPGGWVSLAGSPGNAILVESGLSTYSAVYSYPRFANWRLLDPSGSHRKDYNRYAHIAFTDGDVDGDISSPQADVVQVHLDPCAQFAQVSVRHVLSDHPVRPSPCLRQREQVIEGKRVYLLYDVVPA